MQTDRVDSTRMYVFTRMISDADRRWGEQDQHEFDKYKDSVVLLQRNLELLGLGKEERLDDSHERLYRMCKQRLQCLHEQESLDSLQRKLEEGEVVNRLVMKHLEDMGKEPGYEKLPQEEIDRFLKVGIEHHIKDRFELHMCTKWDDYFKQSLGIQGLQPLSEDLPEFRRQIERLRRQTLQHWQHELLCIERKVNIFSEGDDTNNVFSSIYMPSSVRAEAQGLHTKMDKIPTTVGSVGCAKADESSALLAIPTSLHQHFLLNNPGREGIDTVPSNHDPTAHDGGSSSEDTAFTLSGGSNKPRETDHSASNDMPDALLDTQAQVNCTGNFNVLSNLMIGRDNIVIVAANGGLMETFISGSVCLANLEVHNVHYNPDLGNIIIISGSMLDNSGYGYEVGQGKFTITDLRTARIVGEGRLVDGKNYVVDYLKIPDDRTRVPEQPGLVARMWNVVSSALHRLGLKY